MMLFFFKHLILNRKKKSLGFVPHFDNKINGLNFKIAGSSPVVQQTRLASMRTQVQSWALLSGLWIRRCHELWYSSKMWLGSDVVAVA